jgi:NAD+ kinase
VKTLALVAKKGKLEAVALAAQIRARYPQLETVAERHLASLLGWELPPEDSLIAENADLVVVLGGDGTLIHASRLLRGRPVPILGVNLGSLGFMTEITQDELFKTLDDVIAGNLKVDLRMKLDCRLLRDGKVFVEDQILNDVVINKGALARIADHETSIDGQYVTTYKSDGVIVCTPTGSTAYALSAGGPIVHPRVDCMVIAPICPHALTQRPLLVPGEQRIQIALKGEASDMYLTLDGQVGLSLQSGDVVEVKRSAARVHLIQSPERSYYSILRQKLHWGER